MGISHASFHWDIFIFPKYIVGCCRTVRISCLTAAIASKWPLHFSRLSSIKAGSAFCLLDAIRNWELLSCNKPQWAQSSARKIRGMPTTDTQQRQSSLKEQEYTNNIIFHRKCPGKTWGNLGAGVGSNPSQQHEQDWATPRTWISLEGRAGAEIKNQHGDAWASCPCCLLGRWKVWWK